VKTLNWIGWMSGVGLIAISAPTFASTSAPAAAPAVSTNQQVAETQQQQQDLLLQPQQKNQQHQNQQNGKPQQQQNHQSQQQPQQQKQSQQNNRSRQLAQPAQQKQPQQNQQSHHYDWAAYQPGHRPPQWQQYRRDFNPRPYQVNRQAERRYHWQPYVQPRGWYAQRWVYGQILPIVFWGREYWLDNYVQFGLIDPPYGYVWVRDGDDALLVDVETGQILSVQCGVFYS
jgi:Ni/Co efflux regulator RcnB